MSKVKRVFTGEKTLEEVMEEIIRNYFDSEDDVDFEGGQDISVTHKKSPSNLKEGVNI
jgi:hypothetical protein